MIQQSFWDNQNIEVWPSFLGRVWSQLNHQYSGGDDIRSRVTDKDTYDNHFRASRNITGFVLPVTVMNLIRLQIDGRPGELLTGGQQNVFHCESEEILHPGFAIQAQWLMREYDKKYRWLVMGTEMQKAGERYGYGSFRPAGSKFFWRREHFD